MSDYAGMIEFTYSCQRLSSYDLLNSLIILRKWLEDAKAAYGIATSRRNSTIAKLAMEDIKNYTFQIKVIENILNARLLDKRGTDV